MTRDYAATEPSREEVDAMPGRVLLEFGAPWCGHCIGAQSLIEDALRGREDVRHIKIEDGRGRRLGRSFAVKLWPTLVLLHEGTERARSVRPRTAGEIAQLFDAPG